MMRKARFGSGADASGAGASGADARSRRSIDDANRNASKSAPPDNGGDPLDPASTDDSSDAGRRDARVGRSLKARALDYLSRREHSRAELMRKLAPFAQEGDSIEALVDSLEKEGWLSDARFVESIVHRRAARMGSARIVSELRQHAVPDALVAAAGNELRETEFARAQAVWRKKYGHMPQTPAERAKQGRFMAMRGFSRAIIVQVLKGEDDWGDD